jgi:hypothetical protein
MGFGFSPPSICHSQVKYLLRTRHQWGSRADKAPPSVIEQWVDCCPGRDSSRDSGHIWVKYASLPILRGGVWWNWCRDQAWRRFDSWVTPGLNHRFSGDWSEDPLLTSSLKMSSWVGYQISLPLSLYLWCALAIQAVQSRGVVSDTPWELDHICFLPLCVSTVFAFTGYLLSVWWMSDW